MFRTELPSELSYCMLQINNCIRYKHVRRTSIMLILEVLCLCVTRWRSLPSYLKTLDMRSLRVKIRKC